jgi:vacuolar protein-sorting-associated protein 4
MGGNRDDGGSGGSADLSGMKTEFLVQMDGVGNDTNGILVLAATNLPWKLDPALRRRFQRRIHIGLPETKARASLFEIGIGDTPNTLKPNDYKMLGEITEGFSGSDISVVTQDALMVPVKKITTARHFKKVWIAYREMTWLLLIV